MSDKTDGFWETEYKDPSKESWSTFKVKDGCVDKDDKNSERYREIKKTVL